MTAEERQAELMDKLAAATFTSTENLVSMMIVVTTLFFHLVFTMIFHMTEV